MLVPPLARSWLKARGKPLKPIDGATLSACRSPLTGAKNHYNLLTDPISSDCPN